MLFRGGYKVESFLSSINRYVGGENGMPGIVSEGSYLTAYLGAGYWRAILRGETELLDDDEPLSNLRGVYLVNPDRTWDEIQAVELGVSILAHWEYKPGRGRAED